jgi:response regulator NasT
MSACKIVVADSDSKSREMICGFLKKKGYLVYTASDNSSALRVSRSIMPHLVIMDSNLAGGNAYKTGRIIEDDNISSVIFVTNKLDSFFYERLKTMNLYAYVLKPVNLEQLHQTVEFSINNVNRLNELKTKIEQLETSLKNRKKLDRAKGIIMKMLNVSEDEAYGYLRKKSMDMCISIDMVAEKIIKKYG